MTDRYKFFQHAQCEFFPCHDRIATEKFSCLFCYCPLYSLGAHCGGGYQYLDKTGVKDCSGCTFPHDSGNYDAVLSRLSGVLEKAKKAETP